jgi:hypothetical protein
MDNNTLSVLMPQRSTQIACSRRLNKPRGRSSCTLQAAPKEFAASGPESNVVTEHAEQGACNGYR